MGIHTTHTRSGPAPGATLLSAPCHVGLSPPGERLPTQLALMEAWRRDSRYLINDLNLQQDTDLQAADLAGSKHPKETV